MAVRQGRARRRCGQLRAGPNARRDAEGDRPALDTSSSTAAPAAATLMGRAAPRILRVADPSPSTWAVALDRAVTLGFDTVLLPAGLVPAGLSARARSQGIALMGDVFIDKALADEVDGTVPFTRVNAGNTDPRTSPSPAPFAALAVGTLDDAAALAAWWGPRIAAMGDAGLTGVRLLGLRSLPGWALPSFLAGLREACPGLTLFGWTPGLAWSAVAALPPGILDLVASSLPWWDGEAAWFWRELDALRAVAPVVCDGGRHGTRQGAGRTAGRRMDGDGRRGGSLRTERHEAGSPFGAVLGASGVTA